MGMATPIADLSAEPLYRVPEPPSAAYLASQVWTAERVQTELVRDDRHWPRYEFVDGELLVTSAPNLPHQLLVGELHLLVAPYAKQARLTAMLSPADIRLDDDNTVQPDLFVIDPPYASGRIIEGWSAVRRLHLALEVLSPSSLKHDRTYKRDLFARWQIPVYWVVDPWARVIEETTPRDPGRPRILAGEAVWHPTGAPEPFVLGLPAFFERVLGAKNDPNAAVVRDAE